MRYFPAWLGAMLLFAASLNATIFSSVTGLIHDPEHRPVAGAKVTIWSEDSHWTETSLSDNAGQFRFENVALGHYFVKVEVEGFVPQTQKLTLGSGAEARLHFPLAVNGAREQVEVRETAQSVDTASSTSLSTVNREQIADTPGATQTNSMAAITNYVPGAYVVHDQLHIRGGHQVSWLLDGVPVPNTSIASNVGPQFDPKDIDSIEVQRGGYSAEYGDRTYGVFNVVTRSGFERDRQAEVTTSYGSFNNTNDQISFGDHSERAAYYGSLSGYRTDLGLETPVQRVINDLGAGVGGFTSLIFNRDPDDQLRLVASARGDHYQVPVNPANPLHDVEDERDDFVNFTWLHTVESGVTLTFSPFYHYNSAHYSGGSENAVRSEYARSSNYAGAVATLALTSARHNFHAGVQVFEDRDSQLYGVTTEPPGGADTVPASRSFPSGDNESIFLEDQLKATDWLTFNAGLRLTHFGGTVSENAADPRIGAAVRIPHLGWALRAFYGRYYQAPPLVTVNDSAFSGSQCLTRGAAQCFFPLHGERDEQHEVGVAIPLLGWVIDLSNFRTAARNFFDHDALGNSNVFFPVTLAHARIRGAEAMLTSPRLADRAQVHVVYSHQYAQWAGNVTGGLIGGDLCDTLCFLDHDQRDTLSAGLDLTLPRKSSLNFVVDHGSGFLDSDGPAHLPAHTTFDLALAKSFRERFTVRISGLNLGNNHYLLDNSNTFGGTHFANPRELAISLTYKFRY